MEKQVPTADRLNALAGFFSTMLSLIAGLLSLLGILPPPTKGFVWWAFLGVLFCLGLWLLWSAFLAPKSRLLQPERFVIRPEERRHLKGREEEISELSDLCEHQSLVFLEGESGAGKTALVRAGLVDECLRRRRLHPVYLDLSGADWEERLPTLLAGEVWRSLSESDREILALKCPSPPAELFPLLVRAGLRLARTPLLIFDQLDDYQATHRHRFREGPQAGAWITQETLTGSNRFWQEVARLLSNGAIHCLFISRTDNAAGFDAVRFVEARTYRLPRVSRNLIAPLLDEIIVPESEDHPVVAHPEKGWEILKGRLLSDLTEDDTVLPVQLSVALQALRRFPALTLRQYERCGGAVGLERFHIEQTLIETAQVSGLAAEQVRRLLVSLVEPVRHKALPLGTSEIKAAVARDGALTDDAPVPGVAAALSHLEGRGLVRRRPAEQGDDDIWLLQHDFLCRGVLAAERHANRWRAVLQEGASRWGEAGGVFQRWKALLSPWEQAQLAFRRLTGRLRYGSESRFALLSTLRLLPYALLLVGIWGASFAYRGYEVEQQAEQLLAILKTSAETEKARALVSAREPVRRKVFELAFADKKKAELALHCMPMLLHVYLGLDPTGERRNRFWARLARPALEKAPEGEVVDLAFDAWREAPGDEHDRKALVGALGRVATLEGVSLYLPESLARKLVHLVPHLDSASVQTLGDALLKAMTQAKNGSVVLRLAQLLAPLAPQLRDDQARTAASCLVTALTRDERDRPAPLGLLEQTLLYRSSLDPGQVSPVVEVAVRYLTETFSGYVPGFSSRPDTSIAKSRREMIEKLDPELKAMVEQQIADTIARETQAARLAQLMRGFALLAPATPKELRQRIIARVADTVAEEKDLLTSAALASALGELALELSPEQARKATAKLLQATEAMAEERNVMKLGELGLALGLYQSWLNPEEARHASALLLEPLQSPQTFSPVTWDLLMVLPKVAPRLSGEQRVLLLDELIAACLKSKFFSPLDWKACLKALADLSGADRVRDTGRKLLGDMEQEKDRTRFGRLAFAAAVLADYLDPNLLDAIGNRLVRAMEEDKSDAINLPWLGRCLGELKGRISKGLLQQGAVRLMEAAGTTENPDGRIYLARSLEGLIEGLEPADARRATETVVWVIEGTEPQRPSFADLLRRLELPEGRFSEEAAGKLSERIARKLEQYASEKDMYFGSTDEYGISDRQAIPTAAALLKRAPDQVLLDILKRPFAVRDMREIVLRAWELKTGKQFDNDLWQFVKWATTDPRTRYLDFGP